MPHKGRASKVTTELSKAKMLKALAKSMGIVSHASKATGIARGTHNAWLRDDPEYAAAYASIKDDTTDMVESVLYKQCKEGNTTAMLFYLKCQAKARGYVERQEIAGVKDQPVEINVVIGKATES